ncbi:NAD(P)-dependent oxidoreductase [Chitinophaga nivalis]|uniref:NAD(P)-binding domain-containing protein n=1 Tax=Chitinophaga nivalis TaxID=2991709 RepID=A0ABT3IKE2_9BACT|nr:NAD(P)-dependent oxidoreductase [Chitinophaga nivalis]MCW3465923.1 NAD(P)-binding domain-containing protein [Chitinophaga nivalis]MCW3484386.1 NAD(P)-binding domain-containing protein [Chitinophaga nivalis]
MDTIPQILLLDTIADKGTAAIREFAHIVDGRSWSQEEIRQRIAPFDGLVIKSNNWIGADLLRAAVNLKVIGRAGAGLDNIDVAEAAARNIEIICSPEGNVCSVAEYVICMAVLLGHQLQEAHEGSRRNDFRRHSWQGRNLQQMTVGIIGLGNIGRGVLEKIAPLCRHVYGYDPYVRQLNGPWDERFTMMEHLHEILQLSDIVTLHLPLTAETTDMFDDTAFSYMRPGSILINSSRGRIINDQALLKALKTGVVASCALDSLYPDPVYNKAPEDATYSHFFVHHPRVYYTPHIAAGTKDALEEVACNLARKMKACLYKSHSFVHPLK